MDDRTRATPISEAASFSDEPFAEIFTIDYAAIAAATEPDQPGGRIVYSSGDYATEEEADAALEDLFDDIMDRVTDRLIRAGHGKA